MNLRRNLIYFWRINLAVLLGAALAATVLTGALLVGDSVRGSLRDLTLTRLGAIDDVLVSNRFFRENLAADIVAGHRPHRIAACAPAILLTGAAVNGQSRARATSVNILGVDGRFTRFFRTSAPALADSLTTFLQEPPRQIFPSVVINQALQKELGVAPGDALLLYLERHSDIHRELLFADREADALVRSLRLTVRAIVPDEHLGRFGLQPAQTLPLNAFVALPVLQRALDQPRSAGVNALFLQRMTPATAASEPLDAASILQPVWRLEDLGLRFRRSDGAAVLESREFILENALAAAAEQVAESLQVPVMPVFTYLANEIWHGGQRMPYATVAALDISRAALFGGLTLADRTPAPAPAGNEILLNRWAADDLLAHPRDMLKIIFYQADSNPEGLRTDSARFVVSGTVRMSGLGANPLLTPEFPGIHDAPNIRDWDPPFPVHLDWIRPKDEAYWDQYRAAPRAFISLQSGQRLWQSRFGKLTSLWLAPGNGNTENPITSFNEKLLATVRPEQLGMAFDPVKARGLQAAAGATDFSGLFIGFSLFLIVAAVLLVGLLFRLGVEQRVREVGILLATGYPLRRVQRQFLGEGLVIAGLGTLLGIPGALGYAALMMTGLRTWWSAATGTGYLFLHVSSASLVTGFLASLAAVALSIWLTLRKLQKIPAVALVAGVAELDPPPKESRGRLKNRGRSMPWLILSGAVLLSTGGALVPENARAGLFFGSGALLLIAGLIFTARWLRGSGAATGHPGGLWSMAARNNARKPSRSMLGIALVAGACFVIVSVGAFRTDFREIDIRKASGTGGYALVAQSDIPLFHDLNTDAGRFALGISGAADTLLNAAGIMPFRLRPGEDASCLNLYQPRQPRILGVPKAQIGRGGFRFQASLEDSDNPWQLLEKEIGPGIIPAIGDANSVQWILHAALGQDIAIPADNGQTVKLRLVALLSKSIFQSELLIAEESFRKYFPSRAGYRYFLIDAPPEKSAAIAGMLENNLGDYGLDVTSTTEKLAGYQAVENTYLSVFQTLGGLGLLLGTLGLGIVLFRNVLERRGELATLRAFGFRRQLLRNLLLAENGLLILWGMLIGTVSALIAVFPQLFNRMTEVPWLSLGLTLLAVFLAGIAASALAAAAALRIPLLPALKAE